MIFCSNRTGSPGRLEQVFFIIHVENYERQVDFPFYVHCRAVSARHLKGTLHSQIQGRGGTALCLLLRDLHLFIGILCGGAGVFSLKLLCSCL